LQGQNYCFGTMMHKDLVIPAQAGIPYRRAIADWPPAFAGVTNSDIASPNQQIIPANHRTPP
jgi:hypothetical protein